MPGWDGVISLSQKGQSGSVSRGIPALSLETSTQPAPCQGRARLGLNPCWTGWHLSPVIPVRDGENCDVQMQNGVLSTQGGKKITSGRSPGVCHAQTRGV